MNEKELLETKRKELEQQKKREMRSGSSRLKKRYSFQVVIEPFQTPDDNDDFNNAPKKQMKNGIVPAREYLLEDAIQLECFECTDRFDCVNALDSHIRKHFPVKMPMICPIEDCGLEFKSHDEQSGHIILVHYHVETACSICGKKSTDHYCYVDPASLVGQRISVRWFVENGEEEDIVWFSANVESYNYKTRTHVLHYEEDNETRMETLADRFWRLLEQTPDEVYN
jgi:hypothetical protein